MFLFFLSLLFCLGYLYSGPDRYYPFVCYSRFWKFKSFFMCVKMKLKLLNKEGSKDLKRDTHV